jgi:NAD(P)H-dependent FMN reductase
MITIISGTDRKTSMSAKIAHIAFEFYKEKNVETTLIDLRDIEPGIFNADYGKTSDKFQKYQEQILDSDGILVIVPEYNGSFPGALKYFIDLLKFPESLYQIPASFIGVAAGEFGGVRAVEQLEMVFQYREAHIHGKRTFFKDVFNNIISEDGNNILDEYLKSKFETQLIDFAEFVKKIS